MARPLRALNASVGAALVLLGLALPYAFFIDTGHAPGSDAFRLIQFHFVLTGVVSLAPVVWRRRDVLMTGPILLLVGVNGWLGALALLARDPGLYWALVFFASSSVGLAHLFATDVVGDDGEAANANGETAEDAGLVPANFGAGAESSNFSGAFLVVGFIALMTAVIAAVFFFGGVYCTLLKTAVIDQSSIDLTTLYENLADGAANQLVIRVVAAVVVVAIVYGALFLVTAAIRGALRRRYLAAVPEFDRDLSREERIFVRDALEAVSRYVERRAYAAGWRALHIAGIVLVCASFAGAPLAIMGAERLAASFLESVRAGDPIHLSAPLMAGGFIGGFFLGPLSVWALYQFLGARFGDFGEYLYAAAGWNSLNNRARTNEEMLLPLVRFVRAKTLDLRRRFDPEDFIHMAFRESEGLVYKSTLAACLFTIVAAAADIAYYQRVDDRGVSYAPYLTFTSKRVDLADLDRVELECALFGPDDEGEIGLRLAYALVEDSAFRINLLDGPPFDAGDLANLERLDAALGAAGRPIIRAERSGWRLFARKGFIDTCAQEITARYEPEIAARLIRLLRADAPAP